MSITESALAQMTRAELREVLQRGHAVDLAELNGHEFHGVSLGLGRVIERLSWKTFIKTFLFRGDALTGWNVRIDQRDPYAYEMMQKRGAPLVFGHYEVRPLGEFRPPLAMNAGVVIDYSRGARSGVPRNAGVTGRLRDPIVSVNDGDSTLLLGWTYVDAGKRLGTPSFFSLKRGAPIRHLP